MEYVNRSFPIENEGISTTSTRYLHSASKSFWRGRAPRKTGIAQQSLHPRPKGYRNLYSAVSLISREECLFPDDLPCIFDCSRLNKAEPTPRRMRSILSFMSCSLISITSSCIDETRPRQRCHVGSPSDTICVLVDLGYRLPDKDADAVQIA